MMELIMELAEKITRKIADLMSGRRIFNTHYAVATKTTWACPVESGVPEKYVARYLVGKYVYKSKTLRFIEYVLSVFGIVDYPQGTTLVVVYADKLGIGELTHVIPRGPTARVATSSIDTDVMNAIHEASLLNDNPERKTDEAGAGVFPLHDFFDLRHGQWVEHKHAEKILRFKGGVRCIRLEGVTMVYSIVTYDTGGLFVQAGKESMGMALAKMKLLESGFACDCASVNDDDPSWAEFELRHHVDNFCGGSVRATWATDLPGRVDVLASP